MLLILSPRDSDNKIDDLVTSNFLQILSQSREKFIYYEHKKIGFNYRMSNVLASIARAQLNDLNKLSSIMIPNANGKRYTRCISWPLSMPPSGKMDEATKLRVS